LSHHDLPLGLQPVSTSQLVAGDGSPVLAAAMIVRNETRHLDACLQSIGGVVDEIVVVDTGSTDDTRDIARRHGAQVYELEWPNDFAAARNWALERTRADWILYIDADERVVAPCPEGLREVLADPLIGACYVHLSAVRGFRPYRELRLFRNHPLIRFEGAMHETVWPGVERYCRSHDCGIAHSGLRLDHVGYEGSQEHKRDRDLPLLRRKLADDPDHVYSWWHLGRILRADGCVEEARSAWRNGIEAARRRTFLYWADSLVYAELIELDFDQRAIADALLAEAMERYPDHAYLLWLDGQRLIRDGDFEQALTRFQELVEWDARAHESDDALGYPERLFGAMAFEGLASCCFKLGRYAESARWFKAAADAEPERLEYRVKRDLSASLAANAQPA
jgi:glycosyltransferase involved in cell wall biosynthesis